MPYTDKDMQVATQIAYMDFDLSKLTSEKDCSIRTLLQNSDYLRKAEAELKNASDDIKKQEAQAKINLYYDIIDKNSIYGNWILKSVKDDNANSGLYACMIETGANEAIIAYRGSESFNSKQMQKDWIEADFGLLNSEETRQQRVAEEYMKELWEKYGKQYNTLGVTGHSLGGNLAMHAAVAAPEEMRDSINQIVSFDGPGFSKEYISAHRKEIEEIAPRVKHYQWSLIGNLLSEWPGVKRITTEVQKVPSGITNVMKYMLFKHDTCFLEFDEAGYLHSGENGAVEEKVNILSRVIDDVTKNIGVIGCIEFICLFFNNPVKLEGKILNYSLEEEIKKQWEKIKIELYKNYRKNRDTNFMVKQGTLEEVITKEQYIQKELWEYAQEIRDIKKSLSISGIGIGFLIALNIYQKKVEKCSKMMNKMKKVLINICFLYRNTEEKIVNHVNYFFKP